MARLSIIVVVAGLLLTAGCGGGKSGATGDTTATTQTGGSRTVSAPAWAAPLLARQGPEGAAVMASSDFAAGTNRVSFLLVRSDNSLVRAPVADVYYRPRAGGATRKTVAKLVPIGAKASGQEADDVKDIYVATLRLPSVGKQWVVIQPRGVAFQGFQILDVKAKPTAIAVGESAPSSDNPTLATEPASRITTARPPDTGLLRYSVADSLKAGVPFVVAFATPAFCQSRTCGPTVDVVDAVRKRFEKQGIRFIHVEIYEDNLPGNGVNRWVKQWKLPTEPWVFVVDRKGIVRDRFEGAVSVGELEQAVRADLISG
jgi:hypothetical protein